MTRRCPHCQQILPEFRLGVRLPPLKARIFDLIMRGGEDGILASDLLNIAYADQPASGRKILSSHVCQINDAIEDTGYRIVGRSGRVGFYRLVKKHHHTAAVNEHKGCVS
jgi:hypothetical protein